MPSDDFYIICPYFRKTKGTHLFCEGFSGDDSFITDERVIKQIFTTRSERNNFIKKYCSRFDYLGCAIAAINEYLETHKIK